MTTPGPLDTALSKLTDAIADAESAAASRRDDSVASARAQNQIDTLEAALAELRRDQATLKSVAGDVTRRLDVAIEQVEAILAGRD